MSGPARPAYGGFRDAAWAGAPWRSAAIVLLSASIIAGPLALLHAATAWRMGYILPAALAAAVLGVASAARLGRPDWRDRRGAALRAGELALLLVALRVLIWATPGNGLPAGDPGRWLREPALLIDAQYLWMALLAAAVWWFAASGAADFQELAIRADEVAARERHDLTDAAGRWRLYMPTTRREIVARFGGRWVLVGTAVVLAAALSRVQVGVGERQILHFALAERGLSLPVTAALACYFLLGLALLGQARLGELRARWYNDGLAADGAVTGRWGLWTGLAVVGVAAAALMLPIGGAGVLGRAIEFVLALMARLGLALFFLLVGLLSLLLTPFRSLLAGTSRPPPALPQEPAVPTQAEMLVRLPDWLGGALFWAVLAAVVVYLGAAALRAHGKPAVRRGALDRWRAWWRGRGVRIAAALAGARPFARMRRVQAPVAEPVKPIRFRRAGAMLPAARVRYLYLRMVERAGAAGTARPPHKTPAEYAGDLDASWPEASPDVEAMTSAFEAARYGAGEVSGEAAAAVEGVWRRLMRALRGRQGPG